MIDIISDIELDKVYREDIKFSDLVYRITYIYHDDPWGDLVEVEILRDSSQTWNINEADTWTLQDIRGDVLIESWDTPLFQLLESI
jgi:hypothetical protein